MESIKEGFSAFFLGFVTLFLASLGIWMLGLIVMLFRELFSARVFVIQDYLRRLWKLFVFSFEGIAYLSIVVAPLLLFVVDSYTLNIVMTWIAGIILSILYVYIRRQRGTLPNWREEIDKLVKKVGGGSSSRRDRHRNHR